MQMTRALRRRNLDSQSDSQTGELWHIPADFGGLPIPTSRVEFRAGGLWRMPTDLLPLFRKQQVKGSHPFAGSLFTPFEFSEFSFCSPVVSIQMCS
jgi:hypothetical protein